MTAPRETGFQSPSFSSRRATGVRVASAIERGKPLGRRVSTNATRTGNHLSEEADCNAENGGKALEFSVDWRVRAQHAAPLQPPSAVGVTCRWRRGLHRRLLGGGQIHSGRWRRGYCWEGL